MEEDIQPVCTAAKLPKYVPPQKGKAKVPKDVDIVKSTLETPLLLDGILFDGSVLGRVPTMKFQYWDLAEREKFPHLETSQLMKQRKEGLVTALQPRRWLCKVEEARLLDLLWIPYFHQEPITIFVIRQLLFLVHDGYLWLEELIPITTELIHRISCLPRIRRDPTEIVGQSRGLALAKAMKKKYRLEKKQRGYVITSIQDKGVHVATQLLVGKVMRKCHGNEVLAMVITPAEQCTEGVQFNWMQFLCEEFLMNYKESQEQGNTFHYVWFLLSILLVAGELLEDNQFPPLDQDLLW